MMRLRRCRRGRRSTCFRHTPPCTKSARTWWHAGPQESSGMPAEATGSGVSPARGFVAEHAHYDDDLGFWESHADRLGGPVCDLGAAAGRVTLRVAARGHEVWAVDTDPEMLEVLMERADREGVHGRVHPVHGSMTDPLPVVPAGLVMVPMNTLQLLLAPDDRLACMRNGFEGLRPGGEMIFDLAMPHLGVTAGLVGSVLDTGHSVDPDNGDLLLHTATFDEVDVTTGDVALRLLIERIRPDGTRSAVERAHRLHLYDPEEIPPLAEAAGLAVVSVAGGFRGEPLGPDAERHVWRLTKESA
ncbi:MAG: class I SAM-dependent methyltransferase [Actinobacteria bacterium]|nr:class I SAM-dependent methyltransferase [Actinomycetota bacterium]